MTITVRIPWEPQPQVSPNSRGSTRNKLTHHRSNAGIATLAVRSHRANERTPYRPPDHPVMDITVAWSRGRNRQDLDNIMASCKGVIDGVTRELGFDDRRFVAFTIAQTKDPDGIGFTDIHIREATEIERKRAA